MKWKPRLMEISLIDATPALDEVETETDGDEPH